MVIFACIEWHRPSRWQDSHAVKFYNTELLPTERGVNVHWNWGKKYQFGAVSVFFCFLLLAWYYHAKFTEYSDTRLEEPIQWYLKTFFIRVWNYRMYICIYMYIYVYIYIRYTYSGRWWNALLVVISTEEIVNISEIVDWNNIENVVNIVRFNPLLPERTHESCFKQWYSYRITM